MWATSLCTWGSKALTTGQRGPLLQACRSLASAPKSNLAQLRKSTGYSLSLCKKALAENNQDLDTAKAWLKEQALKQGWDKAGKLEGRNTAQGLVGVLVKGDHASVIELNCETDFVGRNKQFHELLNEISYTNLANAKSAAENEVIVSQSSKEDMAGLKARNGQSLADLVALNIGQIGENIVLRRGVTLSAGKGIKLSGVTHPSANINQSEDHVQFGRYGTVVAFSHKDDGILPEGQTVASMARQIGQHIIGMKPKSIGNLENVTPAEEVEEEKAPSGDIDSDVAALDEKKAPEGSELVNQSFLLDSDQSVGQVLIETGMDVKAFVRLEVGADTEEE